MRRYGGAFGVAALLVLVASGCSNNDWAEASPENQGYRWAGPGEPGSFGSAYTFCRSTLSTASEGQRLEGGAGTFGTPGGPNTIPGYDRSAPVTRSNDYGDRRQFNGCMQSQGWVASGTSQPSAQPEPAPKP